MRRALLGFGIGSYALGLIAMAPAALVDAGLQRASDGKVRLAEAQGTLWSGTGQIEILDASRKTGIATDIAWHVMPLSILRGQLVCEVDLHAQGRPFPVTISFSRIELANAEIKLPVGVLGLGVPQLAPLELTGDLALHVASLSLERSRIDGNAMLRWQAAGSRLVTISPLGSYEFQLEGKGSSIEVVLRTLEGPLQLDGAATWTTGARPAMSITARVLPQQREQLAPLLQLIAVERGDGSFAVQLQ